MPAVPSGAPAMKNYAFPATITEIEPGEFEVRFRDVPEVLTFAATVYDAVLQGSDALGEAVEHYLDLGRPVPVPSESAAGERLVPVPLRTAARAALIKAVADQNLTKVALAHRMGQDEKAARRVLSGKGATLDMTIKALRSIGVPVGLYA